ncbi:MAG: GldG family protein [Acidobacteria bacterium]|nr:GldG family protein [Acidobacteriota bacterium]
MRFLKSAASGLGALVVVVAIILYGLVPGHAKYVLAVGAFGLALLAAGLILNRDRVAAALRGKRARGAGASAGYVLTVLAVIVLVNFLATRHHKRFDLTENKAFSLSEQTVKVVESLPREVTVTAFFREAEPARQKLEDLLAEYRYHSPKLTVRYIDPDTHPGDAKRYAITEYGTIVLESGKQESRVNTPDEESLTNALIKVTKDRERVVYFTTGHGEHDTGAGERDGLSLLKGELEKQHYTVKPLVLSQGIPADAAVLGVAGPQKPFLEAEVRMVEEFLRAGGHLLYLQDPETDSGLRAVLSSYGVTVGNDVVVDKVSRLFGGDYLMPLVPADGYDEFHPITKTFRFQTFFPIASSIEISGSLPEGVTATKLAQTSPLAWAQPSDGELKTGRLTLKEGAGVKGPITLGAAVALTTDRKPKTEEEAAAAGDGEAKSTAGARLVVFGDSDFLTNGYLNASGNGDLALNAIAWLAEQEELVSIRPKTSVPRILILSGQQVRYYFWSIVAFAPVTIAVVGVGIWWRRKKL